MREGSSLLEEEVRALHSSNSRASKLQQKQQLSTVQQAQPRKGVLTYLQSSTPSKPSLHSLPRLLPFPNCRRTGRQQCRPPRALLHVLPQG